MVKKYWLNAIWSVMLIVGIIVAYIAFLMLGQAIPRELVLENAQKSYEQIRRQGLYYEPIQGAGWDNWTDAYFINAAVTEYDGNLLKKAVANAYTTKSELDGNDKLSVIDDIRFAFEGDVEAVVKPYSRYWAGILTVYKFLLVFMPVNGIRAITFCLTMLLFLASVLNVYYLLGAKGLIPYLISVYTALYVPQSMCLVFSTDIIMMLLLMNICSSMLKKQCCIKSFCLLFLGAGSILAYLNYWAFPLITLGFPLVLIVLSRIMNRQDRLFILKEIIFLSAAWGAGLVGTVLVKQVLCQAVLGAQSGTNQLLLRMGADFTIKERMVSVINGLVSRMSDMRVLAITCVVVLWLVLLLRTNCIRSRRGCGLLIVVAFYPVMWWFVLTNHCIHGFVKHMYGITYYAVLSAAFVSCERLVPALQSLRLDARRIVVVHIAAMILWLVLSYAWMHGEVHYDKHLMEPYSLETIDTVSLQDRTVLQDVYFLDMHTDKIYLKSLNTILVNLPDDKKDGVLYVELWEEDTLVRQNECPIQEINPGEWFQIPMNTIVSTEQKYHITYSVGKGSSANPYLLLQNESQAVPGNRTCFVDGVEQTGSVAAQYSYDRYIVSGYAKIFVVAVLLFGMQYAVWLYEETYRRHHL